MGEVVISSEGGIEFEVQERELETEIAQEVENMNKDQKDTAAGGGSVVRWERFLPKMAVRVLLVEADDSTRQIIAALLRKCSYRVSAVCDGLKAWEVLKERSNNIDLILTEVELPSISGYALLTLIMEHEVCKNIPVIMMSSQDSVSTVYKCMLKGATDFLVKPVRKNELRNLWQHVWRKQASSTSAGIGPPDESVALEKDEASAENNDISNNSSGYISSILKNIKCIEKGSDDQSSCTKSESETEREDIENVHCLSQPKRAKTLSNDDNTPSQEEIHQDSKRRRILDNETEELLATANIEAHYAIKQTENDEIDHIIESSSREAIDLIGTFDNHLKGNFGSFVSSVGANKFDILPMLDLSLRRSHPSGTTNHVNDEWPRLNHSDASAFSRYITKPMQLSNSTSPSSYDQLKDHETNSDKQLSNNTLDHNPEREGPIIASQTHISTHENTFPHTHQNQEISHPIAIRGIRFENLVNTYNSSIYSSKSGPSPLPSPAPTTPHLTESFSRSSPFYQSDCKPLNSEQFHSLVERISNSVDQKDNKQCEKMENVEDCGIVSPGNDQSGNSSLCTGNSKMSGVSVSKAAPSDCGNEESLGASNRSMQREAALTKFRLKRKDRCFEKKVRYESRKKLAEQRPRVKGQFVRQLPNDSSAG